MLTHCPPLNPHAAISTAVHYAPQFIREGLGENGTHEHLRSLEWLFGETFKWKGGGAPLDKLMPERRSANLSSLSSKDIAPELAVRKLLHRLGYRFRLRRKNLPGKPDLLFPSHRKVTFVHGCFWHCHNCIDGRVPKSNRAYWELKLERNRTRDEQHLDALSASGRQSLVVWECEACDEGTLSKGLVAFLNGGKANRA
jgi:DNA mismatch endonuclease (patch repair protein)